MGIDHGKALMEAVAANDTDAVVRALERGANPNQVHRCLTPLSRAIICGFEEVADLLIYNGASPNAQDDVGFTPLHWAATGGDPKLVRMLIDAGADVNITNDNGARPLDYAKAGGYEAAVALLVDAGAVCRADQDAWLARVAARRQSRGPHAGCGREGNSP